MQLHKKLKVVMSDRSNELYGVDTHFCPVFLFILFSLQKKKRKEKKCFWCILFNIF